MTWLSPLSDAARNGRCQPALPDTSMSFAMRNDSEPLSAKASRSFRFCAVASVYLPLASAAPKYAAGSSATRPPFCQSAYCAPYRPPSVTCAERSWPFTVTVTPSTL